jgi:hypothetical protein
LRTEPSFFQISARGLSTLSMASVTSPRKRSMPAVPIWPT